MKYPQALAIKMNEQYVSSYPVTLLQKMMIGPIAVTMLPQKVKIIEQTIKCMCLISILSTMIYMLIQTKINLITVIILKDKMSFFQKMIKIHQPTTTPLPQSPQQQRQNSNTQNQATEANHIEFIKTKQQKRLKSMHNLLNIELQQNGWQDIQDEPKANKIYKSMKFNLITPLLPLREQLLRDMIVKKKEFFSKTLVDSQILKKKQFKNRLEQSSLKFQQQQKRVYINHFQQSKANSSNKKKKLSKVCSSSISKSEATNKQSFACVTPNPIQRSVTVNQQASSDLNKQVMMKLLNLLEKQQNDRNNLMSISMNMNQFSNIQNAQQERQQRQLQRSIKQKQAPIIINNIMKTPANNISKELMEQQMKIRMLQKERYAKKTSFKKQSNFMSRQLSQIKLMKASDLKQKVIKQYLMQQRDNLNSQRSLISQPYEQIIQISQSRQFNNTNQISFIQQSAIKDHNAQNSRVTNKIMVRGSQSHIQSCNRHSQQNLVNEKDNYSSTKPNSYNSMVKQTKQNSKMEKGKRKREFQDNKHKNKENLPSNRKESPNRGGEVQIVNNKLEKDNKKQEEKIIKAPVLIEIPFDDNNNTKGMTLAEAFKSKIGKLKSQKQKSLSKMTPKNNKEIQMFTKPLISSVIQLDLTKEIQVQCSPLFSEESNFKTISLRSSKESKQKIATKQSSFSKISDKSPAKMTREPSKQLLDRLIYGERAKISKKEMYSLTRKNYQNLPEVQAKKKQAEKKKVQQERMQKLKEYQSSIRTNKVIKPVLK